MKNPLKPIFFLLATTATLCSCDPSPSSASVTKPEDLISKEKMSQMLVDIHIVEGARSGTRILGDSVGAADYMHGLFEKHGVTRAQYDSSFAYYSHFPEIMVPIYEVVIDSLNLREIRINEKHVQPPAENIIDVRDRE